MVCLALNACFTADSNLTESGKGKPVVAVEFPDTAAPGSVQTAVVEVTNPGPGDMSGLLVTFTLVGAPGSQGVPSPLVAFGRDGGSPSIVDVAPKPVGVSQDGTVYRFEPLAEEESTTIRFRIRVPRRQGLAANAVIVSDAQEIDRARGRRIATEVGA